MRVQNRLRELVAEEVRALLGRRQMSGAKLAAAIDRSEMYVSRRLRGETAFDLDDLERIARVLGVHVAELLPSRVSADTLTKPNLAESTSSEALSPTRPPRDPKRQRTRPGRLIPKASSRRPSMLPRPAVA